MSIEYTEYTHLNVRIQRDNVLDLTFSASFFKFEIKEAKKKKGQQVLCNATQHKQYDLNLKTYPISIPFIAFDVDSSSISSYHLMSFIRSITCYHHHHHRADPSTRSSHSYFLSFCSPHYFSSFSIFLLFELFVSFGSPIPRTASMIFHEINCDFFCHHFTRIRMNAHFISSYAMISV